jgi:hypothetical protein
VVTKDREETEGRVTEMKGGRGDEDFEAWGYIGEKEASRVMVFLSF